MGKKNPQIMEEQRSRFVEGGLKRGVDRKLAMELFDQIAEFAGYAFNKSHSAAYALIAYWTAWLKTHYPVAFMSALLQCDQGKSQELVPLLREVRMMGIELLPPDVIRGGLSFRPEGEKIRVGLAAIKNVGEKTARELLKIREEEGGFPTLMDFLKALPKVGANRKTLESMIQAGALDAYGIPRKTLYQEIPHLIELVNTQHEAVEKGQKSLFESELELGNDSSTLTLAHHGEWEVEELARREREVLGIYLTLHPLDPYRDKIRLLTNTTLNAEQLKELGDRSEVRFAGIITDIRHKKTPDRSKRLILTVEDEEGVCQVWVTSDERVERALSWIKEGEKIFVLGQLLLDAEGTMRIFAEKILPLLEAEKKLSGDLVIELFTSELKQEAIRRIRYILSQHPGRFSVAFHLYDHDQIYYIRLPQEYQVSYIPALLDELRQILGETVRFKVIPRGVS
jgi:DNA polymerase-3 subunit alpha